MQEQGAGAARRARLGAERGGGRVHEQRSAAEQELPQRPQLGKQLRAAQQQPNAVAVLHGAVMQGRRHAPRQPAQRSHAGEVELDGAARRRGWPCGELLRRGREGRCAAIQVRPREEHRQPPEDRQVPGRAGRHKRQRLLQIAARRERVAPAAKGAVREATRRAVWLCGQAHHEHLFALLVCVRKCTCLEVLALDVRERAREQRLKGAALIEVEREHSDRFEEHRCARKGVGSGGTVSLGFRGGRGATPQKKWKT